MRPQPAKPRPAAHNQSYGRKNALERAGLRPQQNQHKGDYYGAEPPRQTPRQGSHQKAQHTTSGVRAAVWGAIAEETATAYAAAEAKSVAAAADARNAARAAAASAARAARSAAAAPRPAPQAVKPAAPSLGAAPSSSSAGKAAVASAARGRAEYAVVMGTGLLATRGEGDSLEGALDVKDKALCIVRRQLQPQLDSDSLKALEDGSYSLSVEAKCCHAAPASGQRPAFVLMLTFAPVGVAGRRATAFDCLRFDCVDRYVALESHEDGKSPVEHVRVDCRELRPGTFHAIAVDVRDGRSQVTVAIDGARVLDAVRYEACASDSPVLAFGVSKTKLCWRAISLVPATGDVDRQMVPYEGDEPHLVEAVMRDMLCEDLGVTFDDIASLGPAKRLLNEAVTLPLLIPEYFTGIREPWKGVLLFGPPGTGKTLLARAVSSMNDVTFFGCSSATLTSKWRGEGEKLVRCLFAMARHYAPSILFFDEVDALVSRRGESGEHEASRRFKSELLTQMDGLRSEEDSSTSRVMVLAATNCPWDLDDALLRRLEKRIYIPLPSEESIRDMLAIHLKDIKCDDSVKLDNLAQRMAGFSGADVKLCCRDASMMPLRRLAADKSPSEIQKLKEQLSSTSLTIDDFEMALANTKASVPADSVGHYESWESQFASTVR